MFTYKVCDKLGKEHTFKADGFVYLKPNTTAVTFYVGSWREGVFVCDFYDPVYIKVQTDDDGGQSNDRT